MIRPLSSAVRGVLAVRSSFEAASQMRSRAKGDESGLTRRPGDDSSLLRTQAQAPPLPSQRSNVSSSQTTASSTPPPRRGDGASAVSKVRTRKGSQSGADPMLIVLVVFTVTFTLCTTYLLVHDTPSTDTSPLRLQPDGALPAAETTAADISAQEAEATTLDNPTLFATTPAKSDGAFCRYDGHCGPSKTCSVGAHGRGGFCEPFGSSLNAKSVASKTCLDACLKELRIDEHWYHEQWPVVEWSEDLTDGRGRPSGCLIVYHREHQGGRFKYLEEEDRHEESLYDGIPPSLMKWVNNRFHHVKRVDPLNDDALDNRWMAMCTAPCNSDDDCATKNDGSVPGFVCIENACLRNPLYWGPDLPTEDTPSDQMDSAADMVLVTGATGSYLTGLINLAASARYWAPQYKMVVYNLGGISPENIAKIRSWSNVLAVEWEKGIPDEYPPHVHEGKIYAWKPIIVNETLHKYGSIFWLDSGSTLAGPVQPVQKALQHQGIALMKGQDLDMRQKSFDKTFEWFGFDKKSMDVGPHFSGNTQAFLYPSRYVDSVVIPNSKCALDPTCITPYGASLQNHRYDQTTISILAYMPKVRLPHYTEFLAAELFQLNPDLAKPSFKFVWTARASCSFYRDRDPELRGDAPDGGYYHYLPEDPNAPGRKQPEVSNDRPISMYHGPDSLEGGEEIPDEHQLVRGARQVQAPLSNLGSSHKGDDLHDPKHLQEIQNGKEKELWSNERAHLARLEQVRKANLHG